MLKCRRVFFYFLLLILFGEGTALANAESPRNGKGFLGRACRNILNSTYSGLGISNDNLQQMGQKIQNISVESKQAEDEIQAPFGGDIDARNAGQSIRQRLNQSDVNWKKLNEIDRALDSGQELSFRQRSELASMMKEAISTHKADGQSRSREIDNILLRRLNEISKKLNPPQSDKQDQKSKDSNQKQNPSEKQSQNQDEKKSDSQKENESNSKDNKGQPGQNSAQNKPNQQQSQSNQQSQSQQEGQQQNHQQQNQQKQKQQQQDGQSAQSKPEKHDGENSHNQPQQDHQKSGSQSQGAQQKEKGQQQEGQAQESDPNGKGSGHSNMRPPPDYTTPKGLSETILRNLYLWELRKYHSTSQFHSGMTSFFNYLANMTGQIHREVLYKFQALAKNQLESIYEDVEYTDLVDFSRRLAKSLQDGNIEVTYRYATSMLARLAEIEKYDKLSSTEKRLLDDLRQLTSLLTSKVDRTATAVTRKFYSGLSGKFSRLQMHQMFGEGLLTPGTKANENFYSAISAGHLWSYRFMGLLIPYLNIKEKQLYTVSPTYSLNGDPKPYANGQRVIRTTGDITEIDNFVDEMTSRDDLLRDLSNGEVRYHVRRDETPEPVYSRKAIKKVSMLISDVSGSMDLEQRRLTRNLLQASYVDHHLSELRTADDIEHQTGRDTASHIIYHFTFTDKPGPIFKIQTQVEAAEYIHALAKNPAENKGGGTSIQKALVYALKSILKSKKEADGDLQWASIVLISDGDDGHIDRAVLEKIRDEIGHDTEIYINVILTAGSNEGLKYLTSNYFSLSFTPDKPPEYSYKEISISQIDQMIREATTVPPVSDLEKKAPISHSDYTQGSAGLDIRRRLKAVSEASNLLSTDSNRQVEVNKMAEKVDRMFKSQRMARPDNSETIIRKTDEIVKVIDSAIEMLVQTPIPKNTRKVFLFNLVQDLCQEKSLNIILFEDALAENRFYRTRLQVSRWLETQKESP